MSYPYDPPPQTGGYGAYQPAPPGQGLAIAALVLGILALLSTWIPLVGLFLLVLSLAAVVLGIVALVQVSRGRARGRGLAIAGIILGLLSVVVSVLVHVIAYRFIGAVVSDVSSSLSSSYTSGTADPTAPGSDATSASGAQVSLGTPSTSSAMSSVPVTVTNTSGEQASFTVLVDAVVDGAVVQTSPALAAGLEPGATTTSTATFLSPDRDLTGATYQVRSVERLAFELPDIPSLPLPSPQQS